MSSNKIFLKLVLIGDAGVGKTSLIQSYVRNTFSEKYKATIGADFLTKDIFIRNKKIVIQIWDTAGQERFSSLGTPFYRGTDICVAVFDLTNPHSFFNAFKWIDEFRLTVQTLGVPTYLIGTKSDLPERKVSQHIINKYCKDREVEYMEMSAKTTHNIQDGFNTIVKKSFENSIPSDPDFNENYDLNYKSSINIKLQDDENTQNTYYLLRYLPCKCF